MKSILIIDDEIFLLEMYEKILTKFGYTIQTAQTGENAICLLEANSYDLVITDILLPEIDGNFIVNYIRSSSKSYTPVIGITGTPGYAEQDKYDVVIAKPFTIEMLVENVQKYTNIAKSLKAKA